MSVRLHQLEGFYYTALEGGYARAAAAMPYAITEPAVYQQVRKLERSLGVSLVAQAKPRRTVLTPEGRKVFEFVAPFFRGLPSLIQSVRQGEGARLVIAVEGSLGRDLAIQAAAELRRRWPALEFHLVDRDASEVAELIRVGDADLGLATLGLTGSDVREEPLCTLRVALCIPTGHPLANRRRPPTPADLDGVSLCVYERGNPGRALLESAYRKAGIAFKIAAEAGSGETLRALVSAGVAPAFVPVIEWKRRARGRLASRGNIRVFDVTALVRSEPVRYGVLTRVGAPIRQVVTEFRTLLPRS